MYLHFRVCLEGKSLFVDIVDNCSYSCSFAVDFLFYFICVFNLFLRTKEVSIKNLQYSSSNIVGIVVTTGIMQRDKYSAGAWTCSPLDAPLSSPLLHSHH